MALPLNPLEGDAASVRLASAPSRDSLSSFSVGDLNSYLQLQQQTFRAQLPISSNVVSHQAYDQTVSRSLNLGGDSILQVDGIAGTTAQVLTTGAQGQPILTQTLTNITVNGTWQLLNAVLAAGAGVTLTGTWNIQGTTFAAGTGATCSGVWNFTGTFNLASGVVLQVSTVNLPKRRLITANAGSGAIAVDPADDIGQAVQLGLVGEQLAQPCDPLLAQAAFNFTSGRNNLIAVYLPYSQTITGVWFRIATAATVPTYNNFNGVAVYSGVGTATLTRQQQSANSGTPWNTAGYAKIPFAATVALGPGWFYACIMASWSAITTTPQHQGMAGVAMANDGLTIASGFLRFGFLAAQTTFPATITTNTLASASSMPFIGLY